MNPDRRDRLRDAAIEVLAEGGGRGLTHRAVDTAAQVPPGTTKNYFPTRDALLRAVAERCLEQYRDITAHMAATGPRPTDREGLVAMFRTLLENVAGPGRPRLLAYLELQAEAARKPWLSALLDPIAASDFAGFELAQRAAGLPVTPQRAAVVTLALHAAVPHLLADGSETLAAAGLDDPDRFVRGLLQAVYPDASPAAAGVPPLPQGASPVAFTRTDEWDAHYASGRTFRPLTDAERRLLAAHAPAPADGVALDIGCGLGELARHLATAGYTVDALDHSRTAVDLARQAGGQDTSGVTYRTFDIEQDALDDLPHPAYDLITCRLAWAFVHDRPRVMNSLRERLRPRGVLCVITPTAANVPDNRRGIALDEDELGLLGDGWRFAERHDADGLAFVVLRDPAPTGVTRPRAE